MRIITTNVHLELNDLKQFLENELDKWQGAEPQRDDITVIGVKF